MSHGIFGTPLQYKEIFPVHLKFRLNRVSRAVSGDPAASAALSCWPLSEGAPVTWLLTRGVHVPAARVPPPPASSL